MILMFDTDICVEFYVLVFIWRELLYCFIENDGNDFLQRSLWLQG